MSEVISTTEPLKKITMKEIGANELIEKCKNTGKVVVLAHIYGTATDATMGSTSLGEFIKFKGRFEAVLESGKRYSAPAIILPSIVNDVIANTLSDSANGRIDFAYTILAKPDSNAFGFKYGAQPLIEPRATDELLALRALVPATVKQLAAAPAQAQVEAPKKTKAA